MAEFDEPEDWDVPEPQETPPAFFHAVMDGLEGTNFALGWADTEMYRDFLSWCESSVEAEGIISAYSDQMPSLLVDPTDNVRMISLHAHVATELMKALLEAFENERIAEFLSR